MAGASRRLADVSGHLIECFDELREASGARTLMAGAARGP